MHLSELFTLQHVALVLAGYVVGSARVSFSPQTSRELRVAVHLAKAAGFAVLAWAALTSGAGLGIPLQALDGAVLLVAACAVLLGESLPLPRLISSSGSHGVQLSTVVGLYGALLVVGWPTAGVVLATAVALVALVSVKTNRRASYVLPLIALLPIIVQFAGLPTRAKQVSYVLLVVFIALDFVRVLRPSAERWLTVHVPSLVPPGQRFRPLAASGAVTAAALLVHLLPAEQTVVAAAFGIAALAGAVALDAAWPVLQAKLIRGTTRGAATYLGIASLGVLPAAMLLGRAPLWQVAVAGLTSAVVAALPLPFDRFLTAPLAAGLVAALLAR